MNPHRAPAVFAATLVCPGTAGRDFIAVVQVRLRTPTPRTALAADECPGAKNRPEPGGGTFAIALRYDATGWSGVSVSEVNFNEYSPSDFPFAIAESPCEAQVMLGVVCRLRVAD